MNIHIPDLKCKNYSEKKRLISIFNQVNSLYMLVTMGLEFSTVYISPFNDRKEVYTCLFSYEPSFEEIIKYHPEANDVYKFETETTDKKVNFLYQMHLIMDNVSNCKGFVIVNEDEHMNKFRFK